MFSFCCLSLRATGAVVINEIFYHAPDDLEDLEWIELHNPDASAADISGWKVAGGILFEFPAKSVITAGGYVVLCKNSKLFKECYDVPVDGEFRKSLSNNGDTVDLIDASGKRVDHIKYGTKAPWPAAADGASSSLERITPSASGDRAEHWAASPLPEDMERPAGTPGRANANFSATLPPSISELKLSPPHPRPGQAIKVGAQLDDPHGVTEAELLYRVVNPGAVQNEQSVPMKRTEGREWSAEIPGQPASQLIRIRVRAKNSRGAERYAPSQYDLCPATPIFVGEPPASPGMDQILVIHSNPREFAEMERVRKRSVRASGSPFGNEQRRLQYFLQSGLNLSDAWFELTVRFAPDAAAFKKLRTAFIGLNAKRNALIEAALAAESPAEVLKTLPSRIQGFQEEVIAEIRPALPSDKAAALEASVRDRFKPPERSMAAFLRAMMNPEAVWFGLATRSEFTPAQVEGIREPLLKAVREREEQLSKPGDFGDLQERLGKVEKSMNETFRVQLSTRQRRALSAWRDAQGSPIRPRVGDPAPRPPRGATAFVHVDGKTGETEVFDFIHFTERSAGFKARFHKDRPWRGMTAANVIFEYNDRFVMAEPLAFELYRMAGNAACMTDFLRLSMNGHVMGYHLVFEQVNGAFFRRNRIDSSGDLFKIIWYGRGIEGQHEKQNHPDGTHESLVKLVEALGKAKGEEQWKLIEKHFNVDQVMTYFAVNMVLSHWDGFFNNYFTMQDMKNGGRWEMYPWDQDKTWGFHDASGDKVFYDMPVTFGMEGDRPPGGGPAEFNPGHWWRPGGFFSKPLLANPEFRRRYLKRVRQIVEDIYTEKVFVPRIDAMAARLRPEIPIRAKAVGEEPSVALARLEANVASLKEHLVKRREFLLKQEEIVNLPR